MQLPKTGFHPGLKRIKPLNYQLVKRLKSTRSEGITGIFGDADVVKIVRLIDEVNTNAKQNIV